MTEEECSASESEGEVEIDKQLDHSLETKSRQHNLTTVNVKNIIHVSSFTYWGHLILETDHSSVFCRTNLDFWLTGSYHK